MNSTVKGILTFLAGAGIGFGAGYFISKKQQIKKNDAELAELEAYYKNKYGKAQADILREKAEKEHGNVTVTPEKPSEGAMKLQAEKFKTFDRIAPVKAPVEDYAAKYKLTRVEDDGPELKGGPHDLDSEEELQQMAEYQGMCIITPDEYEQDLNYSKTEITYYEPDELFADEYRVVIPSEIMNPDTVGRGNLTNFGISGEDGVLYVRDDDNTSDYKIYLEESSYEGSTD